MNLSARNREKEIRDSEKEETFGAKFLVSGIARGTLANMECEEKGATF